MTMLHEKMEEHSSTLASFSFQTNHQTPSVQELARSISPGGEEVGLDGDVAREALLLLILRRRGRRCRLRRRPDPGPVGRAPEARVAAVMGRGGRDRNGG
jgi:hypothetical protein